MKVIPTAAGRRINTYQYQQNPVQIRQKQTFDSVSFGMASKALPSINTIGNYDGKGHKHFKDFGVKGHAKVNDLEVDGTLKTGSWIEANSINAQTVSVGDYVHATGKVTANYLETGSFFDAGELDAKTANIGTSAKITGKAKAESLRIGHCLNAEELDAQTAIIGQSATITGKAKAASIDVGSDLQAEELDVTMASVRKDLQITGTAKAKSLFVNGDLNIGNTDVEEILSRGDVTTFKDITRLDTLTFSEHLTNPAKDVKRTLIFESANIIPDKIKIIVGNIQKLVIRTVDKSILQKLEFFHQDFSKIGCVGEKLLPETIAKLVKFI